MNHIVRYADDILVPCRRESSANRALEVATNILEDDLNLTVNRDKTHQVHAREGVTSQEAINWKKHKLDLTPFPVCSSAFRRLAPRWAPKELRLKAELQTGAPFALMGGLHRATNSSATVFLSFLTK